MATIPQFSGFPDFLPLRRFSTADYLQMIESGLLGPQDRVELIGGVIVDMSPAGIPHNSFLINVVDLFAPLLGQYRIAIQATLRVSDGNVYAPDLMLLHRRPDRYRTDLPVASDVAFVLEAAESSFRRDQQVKLPVYAAAGIPEYWIADLINQELIIHREPAGNSYRIVETRRDDDVVSPSAAPELSFTVRQLFE